MNVDRRFSGKSHKFASPNYDEMCQGYARLGTDTRDTATVTVSLGRDSTVSLSSAERRTRASEAACRRCPAGDLGPIFIVTPGSFRLRQHYHARYGPIGCDTQLAWLVKVSLQCKVVKGSCFRLDIDVGKRKI
jgi:hypothetical protein